MLKIAICDDLESNIENLKIHIDRYAASTSVKVSVKAFSEKGIYTVYA